MVVTGLPTLAEVVQDRGTLTGLPFEALWALLRDLGLIEKEILTAMLPAAIRSVASTVTAPDRALTLTECAARLHLAVTTTRLWFQTAPWDATVIERSKTRILVSEARFDALLRDGLHAPSRPARRGGGPRIGRPHAVGQGGGAA